MVHGSPSDPALQRDSSEPARWSDYTGRPGLVVEEVWKWRLWAIARGGMQALRRPEQLALEGAEASSTPISAGVMTSR